LRRRGIAETIPVELDREQHRGGKGPPEDARPAFDPNAYRWQYAVECGSPPPE
jgi:hypothetical protein